MKSQLVFVCILWSLIAPAYPWGREGHSAIAAAAKDMLTPEAKAKVERILGNDDLPGVAVWLDNVRNAKTRHTGPLKDDSETKEFNAKFPKNDLWHYVDLPVGSTKYSDGAFFASKDDIVHSLRHAVDVLEGKTYDMTDQQAVRVLVHLVADAHQPLHAAAGYFDCSDLERPKLVSDLETARVKPNDRGGNQLFYSTSLQLHRFYDEVIVLDLVRENPDVPLSIRLSVEAANQNWALSGDYHHWAEEWIDDSAAQTIQVYRGFAFGPAALKPNGAIERINVVLPDGFWPKQMQIAKMQMSKAAVHLAQLLNAIRFKDQ